MTVGIPGTGLGGLFYFLLVVMMPFRELVLTLRRRSSLARWRRVAFHLLILGAMLGVLWGEAWILDRVLALFGPASSQHGTVREMFIKAGQVAALTSIVVLAAVLGSVAALSFTPLARSPQEQGRLPASQPAV